MYLLQNKPDGEISLENDSRVTPIATLKDEFGGISHIILIDHCYVLVNKFHGYVTPHKGKEVQLFSKTYYWYQEAIEALKTVPLPD